MNDSNSCIELIAFDFRLIQVGYVLDGEHLTLYVVADNEGMKKQWIAALSDGKVPTSRVK